VFWQGNPTAFRGDRDAERAFRERLERQLLQASTTGE
jgi:hypothetical protein